MFAKIIDWINNNADKGAKFFLNPIEALPGVLKFLAVIAIVFLAVVGLIRVAHKTLKLVIGIAIAFVIVIAVWLIFFK